jgi:hypothetical protein
VEAYLLFDSNVASSKEEYETQNQDRIEEWNEKTEVKKEYERGE